MSPWCPFVLGVMAGAVVVAQGPPPPPPPPPPAAAINNPNAVGTASVVGRVLDEGNRAIEGAIVTLTGPGGVRNALTESRGGFVFRDVPRGSFSLTAVKPGYAVGSYGRRRPDGADL